MDVATTLYPEGFERASRTLGVARASELAATSRVVDLIRALTRCTFAGLAFLSVWGAAGLIGTLSGLH
jgi:hypothetical protein